MLIQLQPSQVSLLWENIKHGVLKANEVPAQNEEQFSTRLLKNLLSGKYQCWVVHGIVKEERKIVAIGVTTITNSLLYDTRVLHILSLYGYRTLTDAIAKDAFDKIKSYAKRNKCVKIEAYTSSERVKELMDAQGFELISELFELYL